MTNNILVNIANKTGLDQSIDVFITLIGTNESNQQCFGRISDSIVKWIPADHCLNIDTFSYRLSDCIFPLQVAPITSGRIYFSIKYPLNWRIGAAGSKCVIIEPDASNINDTNYYYLYDKIEFTYDGTKAWFNPTAVDFFCLPLNIQLMQDKQTIGSSGFIVARNLIFYRIKKYLSDMWSNLCLDFYIHNDKKYDLRVISPAKWIAAFKEFGGFAQLAKYEDASIFDRMSNQDINFDSFINYLWTYYANCGRCLKIDCSVLANDNNFAPKLTDYIFSGKVTNGQFVFSNQNNELSVVIDKISSFSLISGAQGSFEFPNHSVGAIIAQTISAAFAVGALPAPQDAILNKEYFLKLKLDGKYYWDASLPIENHDRYSQALHSIIEPAYEFYSFPYDDLLSQDGTLTLHQVTDDNLVNITIGVVSNDEIPDPFTDNTSYDIDVTIGKNADNKYYNVQYNGCVITPDAPLKIGNTKSPIVIELEGSEITIFLNPKIVLPATNDIAANIAVKVGYPYDFDTREIDTLTGSASISFPAPPLGVFGKIKQTIRKIFK